jgi:hypothetical protein
VLHLDKVFVPSEALVGQQGQGFKIAMHALDGGCINSATCRWVGVESGWSWGWGGEGGGGGGSGGGRLGPSVCWVLTGSRSVAREVGMLSEGEGGMWVGSGEGKRNALFAPSLFATSLHRNAWGQSGLLVATGVRSKMLRHAVPCCAAAVWAVPPSAWITPGSMQTSASSLVNLWGPSKQAR